jgi:hypothetical protein
MAGGLIGGVGSLLKSVGGASMAAMALKAGTMLLGDSLETSGKDLAKINDSYVGKMSNVTSMLSMVPGPVGALAAAFTMGVEAGKILNKGLDALGLTSDRVADWMMKLSDGVSWLVDIFMKAGKFFAKFFGYKEEEKDPVQKKSEANTAKKYGVSLESAAEALEKASKEGISIPKALEEMGEKITTPTKITKLSDKVEDKKKAEVSAKALVIAQKKAGATTVPTAPTAATAKALGMTEAEATETVAKAKKIATTADTTMAASSADLASTGTDGSMPGAFGTLQNDGSITLRVENFMDVFAKAQSKTKRGMRPGG